MPNDHPLLLRARRDLERAEVFRVKSEAMLRSSERSIQRLKHFIEQYEAYTGNDDQQISVVRQRLSTRDVTDIAVSAIESSDVPLSIQDILERLDAREIEVGGENKAANLAAYLSKDNRVRHERGYGWMPCSRALFPENTTEKNVRDARDGVTRPSNSRRADRFSAGSSPDSDVTNDRRRSGSQRVSDIDDEIPF